MQLIAIVDDKSNQVFVCVLWWIQIPQVVVEKPRNREDLSRGWDVCVVDKSFVILDICSLLCNLKYYVLA